ncbi:MAG: MarR family transcriptional regulator [Roseiarcus sp.]|jgi:DNA-binding MarR family transcriptional regulator
MRAAAARSSASKDRPRRPTAPDAHLEIRIWLRLLACANRIEAALQRRIVAAFGITLARFDLLAQLERAGGALTMSEASRRMMVTNGAITGLVDRLESEGLVAREAHPEDRRAIFVRLTEDGRARFLAMAREHEGWTVALLAGLSAQDKKRLLAGLGALKRGLDRAEGEAGDAGAPAQQP